MVFEKTYFLVKKWKIENEIFFIFLIARIFTVFMTLFSRMKQTAISKRILSGKYIRKLSEILYRLSYWCIVSSESEKSSGQGV